MSLTEAQKLFAGVVKSVPSPRARLSARSSLVDNPQFESAIVKVQRGEEKALKIGERKEIQHFRFGYSKIDCKSAESAKLSFAQTFVETP